MEVLPPEQEELMALYATDPDLKTLLEKVKKGISSEFVQKQGLLYKGKQLCILKDDRVRWMREAHTSKVAGHFGITKTLQNLQRYVYWPKMQQDVMKFVRGCVLCSTSKPSNRKVGLYTPLPVPTRPWESISMDFLGGLPRTKRGYDYLFVIVDRFSKMVELIPCKKTITGEEAARFFFRHVWAHFGLPSSIISDRDTRFLSSFWKALWSMMDTRLQRSTAFHPQTDGQTEVVNRTMVHLLRGYNSKHPKTWDESLPYIQFAFNRAFHSSTNKSPFEVCLGYLPQSPFDMQFSIGSSTSPNDEFEANRAKKFLEGIQKVHTEVEQQLQKTQQIYKRRHDKHRVQGDYQVGDLVWLHLGKERLKGEGKKLKPIRYGPFKILKRIGSNAYQLELPPYMKIYSVINVEYLKPFEPSMLDDEPGETIPSIDDLALEREDILKEDAILEKKTTSIRRGEKTSYRIGRKGQKPSASKWYTKEAGEAEFPHLQF